MTRGQQEMPAGEARRGECCRSRGRWLGQAPGPTGHTRAQSDARRTGPFCACWGRRARPPPTAPTPVWQHTAGPRWPARPVTGTGASSPPLRAVRGKLWEAGTLGGARRGRGEAEGCPLWPRGPGLRPRRGGGELARTSARHAARCAQGSAAHRTASPAVGAVLPPRARGGGRALLPQQPSSCRPRHSHDAAAVRCRGARGARNSTMTRRKALGPGPRAQSEPPGEGTPTLPLAAPQTHGGPEARGVRSWQGHAHTCTHPNAGTHMHTRLHTSTHAPHRRPMQPTGPAGLWALGDSGVTSMGPSIWGLAGVFPQRPGVWVTGQAWPCWAQAPAPHGELRGRWWGQRSPPAQGGVPRSRCTPGGQSLCRGRTTTGLSCVPGEVTSTAPQQV